MKLPTQRSILRDKDFERILVEYVSYSPSFSYSFASEIIIQLLIHGESFLFKIPLQYVKNEF